MSACTSHLDGLGGDALVIDATPVVERGTARLVRAVQELSQARDVDSIRAIVRHAARELVDADGATFVLREQDECHYVDEDAIAPLWKGRRFPLSACISGWVMLNRTAAAIPDIYADARIPADAYRPTFVQSLTMVPIRKEAPLGAIGTYWATSHASSQEETALLQALADTTAVAMENVRVYAELEQRVKDRTLELELANRELEAFSYSVSHDLSAPLRHIDGFLDLLDADLKRAMSCHRRNCMDNIRASSTRMQRLIRDLLSFAHVSRRELRMVPLDLNVVVETVIAELKPETEGRSLRWVLKPLPSIRGDASLMEAVFQNLIGNAVKFTSRQRETVIEVRPVEGLPDEDTILVRDNGAGFDAAYAHRLFGVFQRLHDADEFEGTGIGLANVQRIIQRHGGRVWGESNPGEGAAFFIALPRQGRS